METRRGVRPDARASAELAADNHKESRARRQGGRRDEPIDPEAIAALPLCAPDDPQDHASAREEHARLREAIAALPEEQRRALVLAAFGGRTAREISGLEGIPLGTAKSRIRSAVRRLRSAMEVGRE